MQNTLTTKQFAFFYSLTLHFILITPSLMYKKLRRRAKGFVRTVQYTFLVLFTFSALGLFSLISAPTAYAAAGDVRVGYTANDVIPTAQVTQATDGTGIVTISFRLNDFDAGNDTLLTF